MNENQAANVTRMTDNIRRRVNEREPGLWEFRFKGKPEGSPAVTRYPNPLAEITMYQIGRHVTPEEFADAANVSYPVFAAVIEDGEEMTPQELDGVRKLIASCECHDRAGCYDALSLDYLTSPALSIVYPDANKGKFLRWKFEQAKDEAFSDASRFLTAFDKPRAEAINKFFQKGRNFYYAGFRQVMNGLTSAVWKADSLRRELAALEANKKRERPARRERRFNRERAREGATV